MRIVVLAPDIPFPANRGGRADIWRRIQAMKALGHEVMLIAPIDDEVENLSSAVLAALDTVIQTSYIFTIRRNLWLAFYRILCSFSIPWHASTRIPDKHSFQLLVNRAAAFKPDVIWLDGPWLGVVARRLAEKLKVPTLYRSHNVEYEYMRGQSRVAPRFRDRLALKTSCIGLRRFEFANLNRALAIFDISVDDLVHWEAMGVKNIHWLPPLPELALKGQSSTPIDGDLVFIGNLGTPNNVRGVEWLLTEVLPRVRAQLPLARCRIVGSNPTPFIKQLLASSEGVELCANVADPTPYLFGAKVLVNPVMSGSGVQVKMLDMLMSDAPIVTASQGTRGLPPDFKSLFRIADDANTFAQAVCEELEQSSVDVHARARAREVFSVAAVGKALEIATRLKDSNVKA